ncbi:MAG: 50S ribosomal protein L10 [Desulfobulbaceae bacterium]|nr:50S ribosomal protein L10 [Desulfobulbaceae bacterium]
MNREEKASVVEELQGKLSQATLAVVADYQGLTVPAFEKLRRELKKNDAEVRVAKNTLLRKAVQGSSLEVLTGHFSGATAIAVSYSDPVASAKVVTDFVKDNPQFEIRSASLDGKLLSMADLMALAKLPSKEVLLSQLLSVMQAVPTGFVRVLNGVPQKMVYLLQAIKDSKDQAAN